MKRFYSYLSFIACACICAGSVSCARAEESINVQVAVHASDKFLNKELSAQEFINVLLIAITEEIKNTENGDVSCYERVKSAIQNMLEKARNEGWSLFEVISIMKNFEKEPYVPQEIKDRFKRLEDGPIAAAAFLQDRIKVNVIQNQADFEDIYNQIMSELV